MNTSIIIVTVLVMISFTILFSISAKKAGYTFFAGLRGEHAVSRELHRLGSKYIILNDLMLRTVHGTCQIDHVVLSPFGIFVIETKNIRGKITGHDEWKEWYWHCKDSSRTIYNPVMQNIRHVEVLSNTLNVSEKCFVPVVVFAGKAYIRIETSHAVLFLGQLVPFIKLFRSEQLSSSSVSHLKDKLEKCNITDQYERQKHVSYVKKSQHH